MSNHVIVQKYKIKFPKKLICGKVNKGYYVRKKENTYNLTILEAKMVRAYLVVARFLSIYSLNNSLKLYTNFLTKI
jgi:fructosamine-3-kinase